MADKELLSQGAEARLWSIHFLGRPAVLKERFKKRYRNEALDKKLTAARLKQEARGILKARKLGVLTPVLYFVDDNTSSIYLEKVNGKIVRDILPSMSDEERNGVLEQIGVAVAKMHNGDLNHGDLTTSNMIIRDDGKLVIIDFGLSYTSPEAIDKGVDLYVLERAITSAHAEMADSFQRILGSYQKKSRHWSRVFPKYKAVRMRGRKRLMVG